ncbi:hypothetical protein ACWC2T_37445 [Streptomyces sp. NPDC001393]
MLATLAAAQFITNLATSIVNMALRIRAGPGLSDSAAPWVVNAHGLAFGAPLLAGGRPTSPDADRRSRPVRGHLAGSRTGRLLQRADRRPVLHAAAAAITPAELAPATDQEALDAGVTTIEVALAPRRAPSRDAGRRLPDRIRPSRPRRYPATARSCAGTLVRRSIT